MTEAGAFGDDQVRCFKTSVTGEVGRLKRDKGAQVIRKIHARIARPRTCIERFMKNKQTKKHSTEELQTHTSLVPIDDLGEESSLQAIPFSQ